MQHTRQISLVLEEQLVFLYVAARPTCEFTVAV